MNKKEKYSTEEKKNFVRVNDKIRWIPIRAIDSNGVNLGIIPTKDALLLAREQKLDLVEVSPDSRPPVCRIMDYGKFKYTQSIKDKKQKSKSGKKKSIQLSPVIDSHDLETKLNMAKRFLESGHQVQFCLQFHRRQLAHKELGFNLIKKVAESLEVLGVVSQSPRMEGKSIFCTIDPKAK